MKKNIYHIYEILFRIKNIIKMFFGYPDNAADMNIDMIRTVLAVLAGIKQKHVSNFNFSTSIKKRHIPVFQTFKKIILTFILFVFLSSITACTILYIYADAKSNDLASIKDRKPSYYLTDTDGEYLTDMENDDQLLGFWKFENSIPSKIKFSILAAEDKNFYKNPGVDYKALARSMLLNIQAGRRLSGASTLAMQVIRMENHGERNYLNKIVEIFAAKKIIRKYGHDRIINHYLTIAPFGNRYHGIKIASLKYFGKPVEDLTYAEASLLCAIPKSPNAMNLYKATGRQNAIKRAKLILNLMRKSGFISGYEMNYSIRELDVMPAFAPRKQPEYAMHAIINLKKMKYDSYVVKTSINLKLQKIFFEVSGGFIGRLKSEGANNLALIVSEKSTGKIISYVGSSGYDAGKGAIDYAMTKRSSGSTLKPFLYAYGMMKKNYTGATVLSDISTYFVSDKTIYQPENADYLYEGPVLYRYALANSRNIPAIQILNEIGVQEVYDFFKVLGLEKSGKSAEYYGLNLAIGGLYVSLYDLTKAYGMLANDGKKYELNWFDKLPAQINADKKISTDMLIPSDVARMISIYLSDPEARLPAFPRMGNLEYPFPVSIKTGTSQGYRDAWAMAYTDRYVIGVWVGDPDNGQMNRLAGLNSAASLMHDVISVLHPEEMKGFSDIAIKPPEEYISRRICKLTGKLASNDSPLVVTEWFRPGTEPVLYDNVFRQIPSGVNGDNSSDQKNILVLNLDQKYAEWAVANNMSQAFNPIFPSSLKYERLGNEEPVDYDDYKIDIIEPLNSMKYIINPSLPKNLQTIPLKVRVYPPEEQVVWYIDGRPYEVADYPYTSRWQLKPGMHTFQVKLAYSNFESKPVTVIVE